MFNASIAPLGTTTRQDGRLWANRHRSKAAQRCRVASQFELDWHHPMEVFETPSWVLRGKKMSDKEIYKTQNWRGDTVYRSRYRWEPALDTIGWWIVWISIIAALFGF
jgi:hypothetical protein